MRHPQPAHPKAKVTIKTQLPGWLKNQIIQAAQTNGTTISEWLTTAILTQLNHGVPAPAPQAPLPTPQDFIREVLTGEPVIGPCGNPWASCAASGDRIVQDSGASWCAVCGIRCS